MTDPKIQADEAALAADLVKAQVDEATLIADLVPPVVVPPPPPPVTGNDYLDDSFATWSANWVPSLGPGASASNQGLLTTGSAPFSASAGMATVVTQTDGGAVVTMAPSGGGEQYGMLAVRCSGGWSGSWPATGYVLEVDFAGQTYDLICNQGGAAVHLATGALPGASVRARLQAAGGVIAVRLSDAAAPEPSAWDQVITDTGIAGPGGAALSSQNGGAGGPATLQFSAFAYGPPAAVPVPVPPPPPPPPPPPGTSSQFVTRSGSNLLLPDGSRWRYVGFGGYQWMGCGNLGTTPAQANAIMAKMRPASCFRLHNARSAVNYAGGNFVDDARAVASKVDMMVQAAKANGQYVCLVLLDYNGSCSAPEGVTGSGFFQPGGHAAWKTWVGQIVGHYANEPTVAMYEIINEPRISSIGSTDLFVNFMDEMSTFIKNVDPHALVETGMYGSYYSGTPDNSASGVSCFKAVNALPNIDIANVHDYNGTNDPIVNAVGDAGNTSGKPMIVGEWNCSINGFPSSPCSGSFFTGNPSTATPGVKAMLDTFARVPVLAGINVWAWDPTVINTSYEQSVVFASHQI